jgi:hypothetical protein
MIHQTLRQIRNDILPLIAVMGSLLLIIGDAAGQISRRSPAADGWMAAEAVGNTVLIHQTPNETSYITDSIKRGELLWIREISEESDWYLVRPPEGALSWVLESDISEIRSNEARIKAEKTFIRPGRHGARLPGPPGLELTRGSRIWLLNREPLVLPQQGRLMTWRAIEPPDGEPRFAQRENLKMIRKSLDSETPEGFIDAERPGRLAAESPATAGRRNYAENQGGQKINSRSPAGNEMQSTIDPEMQREDQLVQSPENPDKPASREQSENKASEKPSIESLAIIQPPKSLLENPLPEGLEAVPNEGRKQLLQPNESPAGKFNSMLPEQVKEPDSSPIALPSSADAALDTLESRYRVMMDQPLISWNFKPILNGCDEVRKRTLTPEQAARLNAIRDRSQRQDDIGQSARKFWDSMRRSRASDPAQNPDLEIIRASNTSRFDTSGLLLPSRRDLDGQLLYNLIGDGGNTIAYLKLPPAAPVEKWLGKKVGIRGRARFNEDLRARLVVVQDVELIDPDIDM